MLSVNTVSSYYSDIQILREVSLSVEEAEIVGLVGGNGSGKTTVLRTISGLIHARSGLIRFCGEEITSLPAYSIVEKGLVLVPEGRKLFPSLSVYENLDLGAYNPKVRKDKKRNFKIVFQRFPVLYERKTQLAGTLSGGEQQMLAIARGLMANPRLIMLDEPSIGLAPMMVKEVFRIVKTINELGATILLVEQNVRQSLLVVDRAYVLENGKIALQGKGEDLLKNDRVITTYLGL